MHITVVVLALLLAAFLGFLGIGKLAALPSSRKITDHLNVPVALARVIGLAECAAALGLIGAALGLTAIGIAAAAGVCLLMLGALVFHLRAGDKPIDLAPAITVLALSALLVFLLPTV